MRLNADPVQKSRSYNLVSFEYTESQKRSNFDLFSSSCKSWSLVADFGYNTNLREQIPRFGSIDFQETFNTKKSVKELKMVRSVSLRLLCLRRRYTDVPPIDYIAIAMPLRTQCEDFHLRLYLSALHSPPRVEALGTKHQTHIVRGSRLCSAIWRSFV